MTDMLSEQSGKMREMAQTTLAKAEEAVAKYMTETQKLMEKSDESLRSSYSATKDFNEKAAAFAGANVNAGFALAHRLLQAKDPKEMAAVYQEHLKDQIEKMNEQFRELGGVMMKPVAAGPGE